jgi:VIT1/CCC1 family predicted Fe2+/Mn2+ transporter
MFGVEDGLVSTTGALAGIAAGTHDAQVVLMAGLVIIMVEALSMAAGQFLSERAVHQLDPTHEDNLVVGGAVMYAGYALGGMVPLSPVLAMRTINAVWVGTCLALVGLFVLGWVKGHLIHVAPVRSGFEILVIGGVATLVGLVIGVTVQA